LEIGSIKYFACLAKSVLEVNFTIKTFGIITPALAVRDICCSSGQSVIVLFNHLVGQIVGIGRIESRDAWRSSRIWEYNCYLI
jgi:hypothetical protein